MSSLQLTLVPMGTGCPHAYLFAIVTVYSGCSLFPAQPRPHSPAEMLDTLRHTHSTLCAHITLGSPLSPEPPPVPDSLCSPLITPLSPASASVVQPSPFQSGSSNHEDGLAQGCCLP